jgi:hypothetical protein
VSGRKPSRPSFDVWRTPIAEEDYRKLRADVRQVAGSKEQALARDGCAAADYRLSGELADRFCSLHLMRDWRMIVGFPAPKEVAVLLIGRHIHGSQRDIYGRFYSSLGISGVVAPVGEIFEPVNQRFDIWIPNYPVDTPRQLWFEARLENVTQAERAVSLVPEI